jgi:hypothetical protein
MEININFKPVMMRKKNSRRGFLKKMSLSSIASVSAGTLLAAPDETPSAPSTLQKFSYDLMVYGASSGGVIAAYTAKMYGLRVLLVEPGRHLGGLSAGGLGATDTGGKGDVITGLAKEFYFRVGKFYGKEKPVYVFEPHVAELIFNQYVNEAQLDVFYSRRVKSVRVQRRSIKQVTLESEDPTIPLMLIDADCFIDASYEGDLLAKAGVSYTVGHESNATYNEKYNGVVLSRLDGSYNGPTLRTSEFPVPIDPYVIPGKPSSGLLPEINGIGHEPTGTGDKNVQSYCFRLCLTQNKNNQLPITSPEKYDPARYELLVRLLQKKPWTQLGKGNGFIISPMPNGKTDWNNYGLAGFSANYTGGSRDYPDADYALRKKIWQDHIDYQKGLLWFLATDERVPLHLRTEMNSWGFCRDDFLDTDGWSHQLYVREARRMIGDYVMTEHECVGNKPVNDGIAYGAYALDGHTCQRVVVNHQVENEGNYYVYGFDPYLISYRSLVPKKTEITNLLVPVCLSASHAAFGSIRMEPVFMALGQVSGIAAYLSIKKKCAVQQIDAGDITQQLVSNPLVNRNVTSAHAEKFSFKKI